MTAVLFAVLALVVDTDLQFSLKLERQKQLCTAYPFYLVERDKKHFIDYAVTSLIQFRAHQCSYTICGPSPSIRCLDPFVSILFPASAWGPLLVKWILYWQLVQFHYSDSRTSLIPFCAIILLKNDAPILCQFMISIKSRNQDPTQISTLLYCEIFQTLIATYTWQNQPQNQEIVNSQYFDSFALRLLSILLRSARPIVSIVRSSKFAWLSPNLASLCCSRILIVSVTNCLFLCHLHCIKSRRKCNSVVCWRFLGLAISASSRAGSVSLPEGSSRELAPCSFCMDATFWNFGQKIATKSGISQKWD